MIFFTLFYHCWATVLFTTFVATSLWNCSFWFSFDLFFLSCQIRYRYSSSNFVNLFRRSVFFSLAPLVLFRNQQKKNRWRSICVTISFQSFYYFFSFFPFESDNLLSCIYSVSDIYFSPRNFFSVVQNVYFQVWNTYLVHSNTLIDNLYLHMWYVSSHAASIYQNHG